MEFVNNYICNYWHFTTTVGLYPPSRITPTSAPKETVVINPLQEIRQRQGMTINTMALALGVNQCDIQQTEEGRSERLRPKLRRALESAGFDASAIAAQYLEWRQKETAKASATFRPDPLLRAVLSRPTVDPILHASIGSRR